MKFYLPTNKQKIELDIKLLKNVIGIENLETIANSNPGFIYVPAELIATIKQIFHSISLTFHTSSSKTIRHQFTNRMFPKKFKIQNYLESSNKKDFIVIFVNWGSDAEIEKVLRELSYQEDELLNLDTYTDLNLLVQVYGITDQEKKLNDWLEATIHNTIALKNL